MASKEPAIELYEQETRVEGDLSPDTLMITFQLHTWSESDAQDCFPSTRTLLIYSVGYHI